MKETWQIGRVKPNTELSFCRLLHKNGIGAYSPITKIHIKSRKKELRIIERAVFPCYVFVNVHDGHDRDFIFIASDSFKWVSFDGDIGMLSDDDILKLKERELNGEFDRLIMAPSLIFKKGTMVKILVGAFANFMGIIVRPPRKQFIAKVEVNGKIIDCPIAILVPAA